MKNVREEEINVIFIATAVSATNYSYLIPSNLYILFIINDIFSFTEFHTGLSKISAFLHNTLPKEPLSPEAELHRKECITIVEGMSNSLNNMKNNNVKEDKLLNAGLSVSSQSLNDTNDFYDIAEETIPRSGSLPDIPTCQLENSEEWQATRALKVCF